MPIITQTTNDKATLSNRFFYYIAFSLLLWTGVNVVAENILEPDTFKMFNAIFSLVILLVFSNLAHCDNEETKKAGFKPTHVWFIILLTPLVWGAIRIYRTRGTVNNKHGFMAVVAATAIMAGVFTITADSDGDIVANAVCEIINESDEPYFLKGVKCDHAQVDSQPGENTWSVNVFKTDGDITMVAAIWDRKTNMIHILN